MTEKEQPLTRYIQDGYIVVWESLLAPISPPRLYR
jgi:hypothetical protein